MPGEEGPKPIPQETLPALVPGRRLDKDRSPFEYFGPAILSEAEIEEALKSLDGEITNTVNGVTRRSSRLSGKVEALLRMFKNHPTSFEDIGFVTGNEITTINRSWEKDGIGLRMVSTARTRYKNAKKVQIWRVRRKEVPWQGDYHQ